MRILLVYPVPPRQQWPVGSFLSRWVPTGLAYIGAGLKRAGHEVCVHLREQALADRGFDWDAADLALRELLREFQPDMVGLSVLTPSVAEAQQIGRMAKDECGEHVLVAAGGVHPTAVPEQTLEDCPAVDVAVVGEGEHTMVALAERGPAASVRGLVFRENAGYTHTPPRPPETDLDRLGPPAYELFDMDYHTHPTRWLIRWLFFRVTNVLTSRGCPNRCRFCAGHLVAGLGVRYHSVEYVIEQIQNLVDRFGVEAIHFDDDTLGTDRDRLVRLCEELQICGLHRHIKWDGCLRVDQAEPELLEQMKAAGCIQVEYGFETGSDRMLRRLGKNSSVELNRRAARLTREAGLRIFADIMVGLPGETEEDFRATMRFMRWARPEVITVSRLCPLPGTPIYDNLPDEVRRSLPWGEYAYDRIADRVNLTAMSDERYEELYREFDKYFVKPKMTHDLLRDTGQERREIRRNLRGRLTRFCVLHPLRALRVPWRFKASLSGGSRRPWPRR